MELNSTPSWDSTPTSNAILIIASSSQGSSPNKKAQEEKRIRLRPPQYGSTYKLKVRKVAMFVLQRIFLTGGIHRLKQHLTVVIGKVERCKKYLLLFATKCNKVLIIMP